MTAFASPRHAALWEQVSARTDGQDLAHDADHVLRVYAWAIHIAQAEGAPVDLSGAARGEPRAK